MKIDIFCRMNKSGVGRHAGYVLQNMRLCAREGVSVRHVDLEDTQAMAQAIVQGRAGDVALFFTTQNPKLLQMIKGKKILWCAFESNRMPTSLIRLVDLFDQIWTPSVWGHDVMCAGGIAPDKVKIVSEGVDATTYFPQARAHSGFVFLSVAKYEKRKGIDELLQAFAEEFPAAHDPDVFLRLKADYPLFPERIDTLKAKILIDPRIGLIEDYADDAGLAALYNSADAFVFPSRAEGFGLPCVEALACGVPTIATHYSGQTVYLHAIPDLFLPIDYRLENIEDADFAYFFKDLYAGEPYGQWAQPDIASLRKNMRQVYESKEAWRQKALAASAIIRKNFDWRVVAETALMELGCGA